MIQIFCMIVIDCRSSFEMFTLQYMCTPELYQVPTLCILLDNTVKADPHGCGTALNQQGLGFIISIRLVMLFLWLERSMLHLSLIWDCMISYFI